MPASRGATRGDDELSSRSLELVHHALVQHRTGTDAQVGPFLAQAANSSQPMCRTQGYLKRRQPTSGESVSQRQDLLLATNRDHRQDASFGTDLLDQRVFLVHGHGKVLGPHGHQ